PRIPGGESHVQCGDWLTSHLRKRADKVWEQQFTYQEKKQSGKIYPGRNIIASFNLNPKRNFRILLCAHWDTRPWADKDANPEFHSQPILGANDGASGVAVLLEMANILQSHPLEFGVDIILFDLEDLGDYGAEESSSDTLTPFSIGATYFIENAPKTYRPTFGVLVDMVGDANLNIPQERFSYEYAGDIVEKVWRTAREIGANAFLSQLGPYISDDHLPFLKRGIKVIDLIDFDYPYWHTTHDTPDKCSPESLQQVGDVLVNFLYQY
ncbi:MAG: M28 family peptidase, partial [Calditrichaeota bacterium]